LKENAATQDTGRTANGRKDLMIMIVEEKIGKIMKKKSENTSLRNGDIISELSGRLGTKHKMITSVTEKLNP
jgi:hypothetical protein